MKLSRFVGAFCAIGLSLNAVSAMSAPVDFNTWTPESYPAVSSFPAGQWNVAGGGSSVNQVNNGQPTFFYSDFNTRARLLPDRSRSQAATTTTSASHWVFNRVIRPAPQLITC